MKLFNSQSWTRALLLAVPVVAAQVAMSQLQGELGFRPMAAAQAQEEEAAVPKQRETRRTPALRNKVYEKLAEAQAAAEAKDYNGAAKILDWMIEDWGKNSLNIY